MSPERRDKTADEQEARTRKRAMILLRAHTAPVEIVAFLSAALGVADAIRTEGEEES